MGEEAEYSELWADYEMTKDKATGLLRIFPPADACMTRYVMQA